MHPKFFILNFIAVLVLSVRSVAWNLYRLALPCRGKINKLSVSELSVFPLLRWRPDQVTHYQLIRQKKMVSPPQYWTWLVAECGGWTPDISTVGWRQCLLYFQSELINWSHLIGQPSHVTWCTSALSQTTSLMFIGLVPHWYLDNLRLFTVFFIETVETKL